MQLNNYALLNNRINYFTEMSILRQQISWNSSASHRRVDKFAAFKHKTFAPSYANVSALALALAALFLIKNINKNKEKVKVYYHNKSFKFYFKKVLKILTFLLILPKIDLNKIYNTNMRKFKIRYFILSIFNLSF